MTLLINDRIAYRRPEDFFYRDYQELTSLRQRSEKIRKNVKNMKYIKKNQKTHFEYLLEEVNKQALNHHFTRREVIERAMFSWELFHLKDFCERVNKRSLSRTFDRYFTDLVAAGHVTPYGDRPGVYVIREKTPTDLTPTKIRRT